MIETALETVEETRKWMKTAWGIDAPLEPIITAIQALGQQPRWISVSEIGYPKPEDEYKHFITIDNKGEITIQEFLLSLDEEPQPYFSGMRNIVAYINMPLPEPYKEGEE